MAIKVGKWDCEQCGYVGNLGPNTRCEKCGASRPENVVFYLTDDSEIVVNANEIRKAKSGADWVCSFCNGHNKVTDNICQSCGNDRDTSDGDESIKEKTQLFNKKPRKKKSTFKLSAGLKKTLIAIVSFFVLFFILALFTTEININVSGFKWERSIEIQEYKRVIEEDWQIPEGGEKLNSYRAIHHYNQIADGTETRTRTVQKQTGTEKVKIGVKDLGNGYFEDIYENRPIYTDVEETYQATKYIKVPVYKTKYKYAVFRWKNAGKLNTFDTIKPALWPKDERLIDSAKFRIKTRHEKYFLLVKYDEKTYPEEVNFELWNKTNINDILVAEKSSIFGTFLGLKHSKNK